MRSVLSFLTPLLAITIGAAHGEAVIHERIEWSDIWITDANDDEATRVLLVGDSIVRGYFAGVEKELGKDVSCARYTTSKFLSHPDFLAELGLLLSRYDFAVIHLNNGLHGWGYTEDDYRGGLTRLIALVKEKAPRAKLVWAMTTPVRVGNDIEKIHEERTPRVIQRNAIAREVMAGQGVAINDLYGLVAEHTPFFSKDGTHFSESGRAAQAKQVADAIRAQLP